MKNSSTNILRRLRSMISGGILGLLCMTTTALGAQDQRTLAHDTNPKAYTTGHHSPPLMADESSNEYNPVPTPVGSAKPSYRVADNHNKSKKKPGAKPKGDDKGAKDSSKSAKKPKVHKGTDDDNSLTATAGPDEMTGGKGRDDYVFPKTKDDSDWTIDDGDRITDYECLETIQIEHVELGPENLELEYDEEKDETYLKVDFPDKEGKPDGKVDKTIILNGDQRGEFITSFNCCGVPTSTIMISTYNTLGKCKHKQCVKIKKQLIEDYQQEQKEAEGAETPGRTDPKPDPKSDDAECVDPTTVSLSCPCEGIVERIDVQIPEECVATTYYSGETTTTGEEEITITPPEEGGLVPGGEPVTHVEIGEGVPMCPKEPPPTVTVTRHPPTVTTPPPGKEDQPDLGLAKAVETLMQLVLKGEETGTPVEGAMVKPLDEVPELQLAGDVDPALTSSEAYAGGVEAGFSDKDGGVTIEQNSATANNDAPAEGPLVQMASITLVEVKIEEEKKERLVIALEADDGAQEGKKPVLPASVAEPGVDICVAHSFRIGKHPAFIATVPEGQIDPVKRSASQTEGVFFVEDDPCRAIYAKADPDAPPYADRAE